MQGTMKVSAPCLSCKKPLDAWTCMSTDIGDVEVTGPQDGDVTVCGYCSAILVYHMVDGRMGFIEPSEEVLMALAGQKDFINAMKAASILRSTADKSKS